MTIQGVRSGSMQLLSEWTLAADRVLIF